MWLASATLTWSLALIGPDTVLKAVLHTRHPYWYQHVQSISYTMMYDSDDVYWLSRYWVSSPIRISCTGIKAGGSSKMCRTLCGTSRNSTIPTSLFSITDDRYYKFSVNNGVWCTARHLTEPSVLPSPLYILSVHWPGWNCVAGLYPCSRIQLLCSCTHYPLIKILSNQLPCSHHFSTHRALCTTTVTRFSAAL